MDRPGWIKLHRKLLDWEWADDPNTFIVFIHLLLGANREAKTWRGIKVAPGQLLTGRIKLSKQTGLSEQNIRTAINKLKSTNEITIKTSNKNSLITITNWKKFQGINHQPNQPLTKDQPTTNQPLTTTKEGKKEKKERRGSSIHADWKPTDNDLAFAKGKGFMNGHILDLADSFKDYWLAASGQKSIKKNWEAAWRTWVNNDIKFNGAPKRKGDLF